MKRTILGAVLVALVAGCAHIDDNSAKGNAASWEEVPSDYVNLFSPIDYPAITSDFMKVNRGSQLLLTANNLADKVGVDFVEWNYALNPYEFVHIKNKLVDIDYQDPQSSFIDLFEGSGLLPYYDSRRNTIQVHPYSMEPRKINQSTVFTPLFEQISMHVEGSKQSEKERLSKDWQKYSYYEGYSIKSTVNAWAKHAGFDSVVWFVQDPRHKSFLESKLKSNDFEVGATPRHAIANLIDSELERQHLPYVITVTHMVPQNRLVVHPYAATESIKTFEVTASSTKANLAKLANEYGYDLEYLANDYRVATPYITVIGDYLDKSIEVILDGYPLDVEVIESTNIIKVRNR